MDETHTKIGNADIVPDTRDRIHLFLADTMR